MSSPYILPQETTAQLNSLVNAIEMSPLGSVKPGEMEPGLGSLNIKAVIDDLPGGLTEEDLVGIISLSMLTECATDSYAQVFVDAARDYEAPWLGRFTERTWVPDEYTHTAPFKHLLMDMGFSEQELEAAIVETLEKTYIHTSGRTPIELTIFGMIQEFLTDHWYGMLAKLLRRKAPAAAYLATRVKRRETLHYVWYKNMSLLQVQADPGLLPLVANTVTSFNMPGGSLVPQYQSKVFDWMGPAGTDFNYNARQMVRHLHDIAGSATRAGQLLVDIAVIGGLNIGPVSPARLQTVIDRLGGAGYTLLGEAVLESVGLPLPPKTDARANNKFVGAVPTPGALYDRMRAKIRNAIAGRIDLSSIHGGSF